MKENYDVNSFFSFLGYHPSNYTPTCRELKSLSVYVRGNRNQLEELLGPTPFVLNDDRFVVSVADFSNQSHFSYFDAAILLPVRVNDTQGSTYYFEYEDNHETVASGREKWGYPKKYANISLSQTGQGAKGQVTLGGNTIFSVSLDFDESQDNTAWSDYKVFPHMQVRAISEIYGPSFTDFDIIARDTSKDYELISRTFGKAHVELGKEIGINGLPLEIVEVLGGEYSVGNFASTQKNGQAKVIASLI